MSKLDSCQQVEKLLTGYLDAELTQQESQRVAVHIDECPQCRQTYQQLKQLQHAVQDAQYPNMEQDELEKIVNDMTSKSIQGVAWFALSAGLAMIIAMAVYAFWVDSGMSWYEKLAMSLIWGGGIGLFISVLRQRLISRKTDKYRRVKL
jgi:predicted anti-sigma-YlaC factor YlaD